MRVQPGDLVLIKTHHFASRLIRFGQRSYGKEAASWNHVGIIVSDSEMVEALTTGVCLSPLDKYPASDVRPIRVGAIGASDTTSELDMRANAVAFARSCVGDAYGWSTILCIALKVLFRGRFQFGVQGTSICSGLAARSLERLGCSFQPWDPAELTPAFLAEKFCERKAEKPRV